MLKLYTDISFLTEQYRGYVFPVLFDLHYVKSGPLQKYYSLTDDLYSANIVVFPVDYSIFYKNRKAFDALIGKAKTAHKPIWIYTAGDFGFTVHIPNSTTFRLGGFHSELSQNSFILPSFVNDPYETVLEGQFVALPKEIKPTIGFVGHANTGMTNYLKSYLSHLKLRLKNTLNSSYFDMQPFYPSGQKRFQYLMKLQGGNHFKTNFILRDKYRAGVSGENEKVNTTKEFYQNIFDNLYTFCIRGLGNFSVRFYETLAVGRIPILINTDCRLPLDAMINWEEHAIILDSSGNTPIETQILNFHNSKTNDELVGIQNSNRLLWETHLRRHSYFVKIHDIFINNESNA
ncbi:hypothetical protein [Hyunsoonleella rubra]|uniref:Exostosin family protein n=1 Tax=Hyunsoonleella rubra TaxID=1737062 RepID=A0ABW5TDN7_9FLAO